MPLSSARAKPADAKDADVSVADQVGACHLRRTKNGVTCSALPKEAATMTSSSIQRVHRRRRKLREQGLRPVQIWVPDTRAPGFAEEALRQGRLVGATYAEGGEDADLLDFVERMFDEDHAEC
jgi:hypothetical protein